MLLFKKCHQRVSEWNRRSPSLLTHTTGWLSADTELKVLKGLEAQNGRVLLWDSKSSADSVTRCFEVATWVERQT